MGRVGKPAYDHEGKEYPSTADMCRAWKIPVEVYTPRIKRFGWNVKDALTISSGVRRRGRTATDHYGNSYVSQAAMCRHYKISPALYAKRRSRGWSVERALTERTKKAKKKEDR